MGEVSHLDHVLSHLLLVLDKWRTEQRFSAGVPKLTGLLPMCTASSAPCLPTPEILEDEENQELYSAFPNHSSK